MIPDEVERHRGDGEELEREVFDRSLRFTVSQ